MMFWVQTLLVVHEPDFRKLFSILKNLAMALLTIFPFVFRATDYELEQDLEWRSSSTFGHIGPVTMKHHVTKSDEDDTDNESVFTVKLSRLIMNINSIQHLSPEISKKPKTNFNFFNIIWWRQLNDMSNGAFCDHSEIVHAPSCRFGDGTFSK